MSNQRAEHKVVLPDDVWSETLIQAHLEQKTASDICEYVLDHYVRLPVGERPAILITGSSGRRRSIYITQPTWLELIACKVKEQRPISAILDQQLRSYLGMLP